MTFDGDPAVAHSTGLVVEQVSLVVGGYRRLDDVTFTARQGTLAANIGPSSAGKSTLIKLLAGAIAPRAGRVRFDSQDVHAAYACLRTRIGVVPQTDVADAQLTVEPALRFAELRLPGATPVVRESPAIRVLGELNLLAHHKTRVDKLSGGQHKRASVAMEFMTGGRSALTAHSTAASPGVHADTPDVAGNPRDHAIAHSLKTEHPAASLGRRLRDTVMRFVRTPRHSVATTGRGVMLFAAVLRYSVTDALSFRLPLGEVIVQAWTLYKVTALPAIMMALPFGAMVAVQASGLINQVGANSLVGAASGVGVVRQGAPITAGLLMGGAAAAAIASDLGARSIRDELDALRVMGVDPVRHLIVPRFLALIILAPILCAIILASAVLASYLLAITVNDVTSGSFWASFGAFAKMVDVWFAIGKATVFGAIVGIVSSLKGIEAKGGPRGVADAVNAAVVINVVGIVVANLVITQLQTMFFPMQVA
jgi:phospholipid/cholesterol/gamma-HCH transport system permease protein